MPRLTVWMVRAALLHLGAGFTFGALMLWNKGLPFDGRVWLLLGAHLELVLLGWTLQLAMGVAYWILPRFTHTPRYGRTRFGWLAFVLLNAGVISAALGGYAVSPGLILAGRIAECLAAASLVVLIWPRVKPFAAS